jgi:hypothetical protein
MRLQATGFSPTYLARWNGTTYLYTLQLPYAPLWITYEYDDDFMIYNNSDDIEFVTCEQSRMITPPCPDTEPYSQAAGEKWFASEHGITTPRGMRLQAIGRTPTYLARWNGTTYLYTLQLPYAPNWLTYEYDVDFMIYNNNDDPEFAICAP